MFIHPDLAPHQIDAVKKMQDGCILWGGVGSGKSRAALEYYVRSGKNEDVYVITTAKKRDSFDWQTEAYRFGIGTEPNATFRGIFHIDSWNNIEKYVDIKNAFFVFDEQRLVGSGKWVKSFLKISRNNRWIMLSATPGDTWMDYIPVFIANGFYRNRTEFKHEHVIYNTYSKFPKVERYVNVQRLVRQRSQILVKMPYEMETTRHAVNVWVDYDEEAMTRVAHGRWNIFDDVPIRDVSDMFYQMRRICNSDPSRLVAIRKLLTEHNRLIVFYNFNYELDMLRELVGEIPYAEWNGHNHQEIPETEKWIYVVQYIAGAEGWNCTSTNAVAFWSLTYSYKLWEQGHGRIDRLDTPFKDLYYYTLRSKAPIDWAVWRSLKSKKNFQTSHFDMTNPEFADFSVQN
jgi:hypothetical protein